MSETNAILLFKVTDAATAARIQFYLDENTRPDYADEVPADEKPLFEAMEFAEVPIKIEQPNDSTIYAWFEFIEPEDVIGIFRAFDALEGEIERHAYFADDEEYRVYLQYLNGELKPIYTIEDDKGIDDTLWSMDWDKKALDWIIENKQKI